MTQKITSRILQIVGNSKAAAASNLEIVCDQLVNSAIVGGISGLSAYIAAGEKATLTAFLIGFGFTFLVKLKEYRKITE